jgi:hypothetical protein
MARTGIRLFVVIVDDTGEAMISLETDRRREILVEDVGVSERTQGIDACVFVLLNDDVEPPVDVD